MVFILSVTLIAIKLFTCLVQRLLFFSLVMIRTPSVVRWFGVQRVTVDYTKKNANFISNRLIFDSKSSLVLP